MRTAKATVLGWMGQAVTIVYRDTLDRARLLCQAFSKRELSDFLGTTETDGLASEPLPENALESKVG